MSFTKPKFDLSHEDVSLAMKTLFGRYREFREMGPWVICDKLGIEVRREENYRPTQAKALCGEDGGGYAIILPGKNDPLDLLHFLGYHELAHCFLAKAGLITPNGSPAYFRADVWCDNFAIAMLFSEKACDFWYDYDYDKFSRFLQMGWQRGSQKLDDSCQRILFWTAKLKRLRGTGWKKKKGVNDDVTSYIRLANTLATHEPD